MLFQAVFLFIMMLLLSNMAKKHAQRLRDEAELEKNQELRDVIIQTAIKKEKHTKVFLSLAVILPGSMLLFIVLLFSDVFY